LLSHPGDGWLDRCCITAMVAAEISYWSIKNNPPQSKEIYIVQFLPFFLSLLRRGEQSFSMNQTSSDQIL
jgi:hypothetical protein